jgi:Ca2+-binding RTX toxin-like protein
MHPRLLIALALLAVLALGGSAHAKTSHVGWPSIDGVLKINKSDASTPMVGTERNDELLGGHGSDEITGGGGRDVLWGDYKPSGQGTAQHDRIDGGAGNDFIYASHGRNSIDAGAGNDYIKAHFGRGSVDCGPGKDLLYISHRAQRVYKIHNCETVSHKTLGY